MTHSSTQDEILQLFEAARQRRGASFEPDRFLAFLTAEPAASGRRVRDTFAGRRRFATFMESVEIAFGICFTGDELERGHSLEAFVDLVRKKASQPEDTQRLAARRIQEARTRTVDEPIKFGILLGILLAIPAKWGGFGVRIALALSWIAAVAFIAAVNVRQRKHYEEVSRRAGGIGGYTRDPLTLRFRFQASSLVVPHHEQPWPYNLPIYRTSHRAVSPDGRIVAEIAHAAEPSMSNPTLGKLRVSNGLELAGCSPCFIWSDDSRYLAVPVFLKAFLSRGQRLVVLDVVERRAYASSMKAGHFQPDSFADGWLVVTAEPTREKQQIRWPWPDARSSFLPFELR